MRKGGLAGIAKGELVTLLRPNELGAIARRREGGVSEPRRPRRSRTPELRRRSPTASRRADLRDPALYVNRELSWLDFNDRVLQLAEDESLPLIERLKFLAIFVTNLDEFFMVRVAGVHDQVDARIDARGPDGLAPTEVLEGIPDAGPRARPPPRPPVLRRDPPGAGRARASGSSPARTRARPPARSRATSASRSSRC